MPDIQQQTPDNASLLLALVDRMEQEPMLLTADGAQIFRTTIKCLAAVAQAAERYYEAVEKEYYSQADIDEEAHARQELIVAFHAARASGAIE